MRSYLIVLGVAILVISVVGGSLYLSSCYGDYQQRLHALGAQAGAPITLYDTVKWQFAQVLGGGIIFGGLIFGSMLMALGWIGETLEQIRDTLAPDSEQTPTQEPSPAVKDSTTYGR